MPRISDLDASDIGSPCLEYRISASNIGSSCPEYRISMPRISDINASNIGYLCLDSRFSIPRIHVHQQIFEEQIKSISNNIDIYYSDYLPTNLNQFTDQNLLAFAGIGNPDNFFKLLEVNNLRVAKKISFPDHYNYSIDELNNLVDFSTNNNLKIVTTEKDFFRIKHFNITQIQYLNVKLEIKNKDKFEKEIIKCLF